MISYESVLKAHSKTELELKSWYPLTQKRQACYTLNAYLFTPGQLELNAERYGVERFFRDVKSHTRFSTAYIPLHRLIDPECDVSPLFRIHKYVDQAVTPQSLDEKRILYELRTLANLYSAEMKGSFRLIKTKYQEDKTSGSVNKKTQRYLNDIERFLKSFRELHSLFIDPAISEKLRTAVRWCDEYISLSTDKMLYSLYGIYEQEKIHKHIGQIMQNEAEYRRSMNYPCVIDSTKGKEIESVLYRENILKKWSQTVLYMTTEETGTNQKIGHVLAGVAAAAAMSFAVMATFFANRMFASYSVPWALIIVVSYILKDRIKEILRGILVRVLPRFIADKTEKLVDHAVGKTVGKTRSMVRFISPDETPWDVRKVRNSGSNPFRSILPRENVIHYRKEIKLDAKALLKEHTRLEAITEIIRIKMDSIIQEMDASRKYLRTWLKDGPEAVKGKRVYHLNLILALSSGSPDSERIFRYRLIVTSQGIERVETVSEDRP